MTRESKLRIIRVALAAMLMPVLLSADSALPATIRGRTLSLMRMEPATSVAGAAIVFLPGDGGWRGTAISIAKTICSWGYDVSGFDTKKYLETFSDDSTKLALPQLASDVRGIAAQVAGMSHKPVILVGWSQGASMAVAAVAGLKSRTPIRGVLTLGLPQSGVLGWDWKATLATMARREPDQPTFAVSPLMSMGTPVPLWMIHGSADEYTTAETARSLYRAAGEPKRLEEIEGANHRFDGHQDELFQSLRKGLAWVTVN